MGLRSVTASREDVESLYRLLLDRSPASAAEVDEWLARPETLDWVVGRFLSSAEFRAKNPGVIEGAKAVDTSRLRQLIDALAARHPQRELYQPVYGIAVDHGGPVQRDCLSRCRLVERSLEGLPLDKMSVLDVGCNMGYVTFHMAHVFSRATGLEYDEVLHEYCEELGSVLGSRATFRRVDFFEQYRTLAGSHDVCLLFSVIHYLVASRGLEAAQAVLADIVSCFDFTIIELSSRRDYSYMPDDPALLLAGLGGVHVTFLGTSEKNDRPIYLLRRDVLAVGERRLPVEQALYCAPLESACSRLYFSGALALKCFPGEFGDNEAKWRHERAAYEALAGLPFVPVLHEAGQTHGTRWILLERKPGHFLNNLYSLGVPRVFAGARDKASLACQLLLALREMLGRGLYWNDLSAHNVLVRDGRIGLIDFAEAGAQEMNDHLAMLTWLLHDLQVEKPVSYENGVYGALHAAGTDRARARALRFHAPPGFYAPELAWIDEWVAGHDTLADLQALDAPMLARIEAFAALPVGIDPAVDASPAHAEIIGLVDWVAFPAVPPGEGIPPAPAPEDAPAPPLFSMSIVPAGPENALVQLAAMQQRAERSEVYCQSILDELKRVREAAARERSACQAREGEGARHAAALLARAERAEANAAALEKTLHEREGEGARHAEALLARAERAEANAAALSEALARLQADAEGQVKALEDRAGRAERHALDLLAAARQHEAELVALREGWSRAQQEAETYRTSLEERARRAEQYGASLEDAARKLQAEQAALREGWMKTQQLAKNYLGSVEERAQRAENHAKALAQARIVEAESRMHERQSRLRKERDLVRLVGSQKERAGKAEELSAILRDDIARLMDLNARERAEAAALRARLEAEVARLEQLRLEAQAYRALPWWKKLGN